MKKITMLGTGLLAAGGVTIASFGLVGSAHAATAMAGAPAPAKNASHGKADFGFNDPRGVGRGMRIDERLDKAVNDKLITSAQKDSITKEMANLRKAEMAELKADTNKDSRKTIHEKYRQQFEAWAKQNNIDLSKIFDKTKK